MAYTPTTIDINDAATPILRRLAISLVPGNINPAAGQAGANCVRDHLFRLNNERPNALQGARTHFYSQAAKSTHWQVLPDGALVSVNQVGFAQRRFGGDIKPVNAGAITIPACAEAYGHRARDFSHLRMVSFVKNGKRMGALIEAEATQISIGKRGVKNKGSLGGKVYYWLVGAVHQEADPSVVPTDREIMDAVLRALGSYLEGRYERK